MQREVVFSTAINSMGYNPGLEILELEFEDGDVYQYYDVPIDVFKEMQSSPSYGQFFQEYIKDIYPYLKLKP